MKQAFRELTDLELAELWRPYPEFIGPSAPPLLAWQKAGEPGWPFHAPEWSNSAIRERKRKEAAAMGYPISDFSSQLQLVIDQYSNSRYPSIAAELSAIATALGTDPTTHDKTIQAAPAGLQPGAAVNTQFTNDVLLLVNIAKGGNNTPAAIAAAINAEVLLPVNTAAPVASGTGTVGQVLSSTTGTWSNSPVSYGYQWKRGGANIAGAAAASYTLVAADSGTSVSCMVTATNAAGFASASSNAIACA
jgi:hypothetical protein